MKKVLLIAALGCLAFSTVSAQAPTSTPSGSRINLSFGLASPVGQFGSTDGDKDEDAGFAETGAFLSVGYAMAGSPNVW